MIKNYTHIIKGEGESAKVIESVKLRRWGSDSKYKCSFAFTLSPSHLHTWAPSPSQLHTFVFRTLHCCVFDRPKGKVHWLNWPQQSTIHIFLYLSFSCSQHILCYALEIIYAHILWKNIDVHVRKLTCDIEIMVKRKCCKTHCSEDCVIIRLKCSW